MRPEYTNPPEIFYDESEARKYTVNSRIQQIQADMTERALELLCLSDDRPAFLLDIGCGSGLSGEVCETHGHFWTGIDISPSMLEVATELDISGDFFLQDAGQGVGFRPGTFDGVISISCIQWLCNADSTAHNPRQRLMRFFTTLYASLAHGARAVFQFYPDGADQIELITSAAMQSGFSGGLIVDYPNSTKRKKYFLCLSVGESSSESRPKPAPLTDDNSDMMDQDDDDELASVSRRSHVRNMQRSRDGKSRGQQHQQQRAGVKKDSREWVMRKKQAARKRGEQVASDSKYTARKRRPRF